MNNSINVLSKISGAVAPQSLKINTINLNKKAEILFITSYPPRECGIATYSQDLITAINAAFSKSFNIAICALENDEQKNTYNEGEVKYILNTDYPKAYITLANFINEEDDIKMVLIQHEFGFFKNSEFAFLKMLKILQKPVSIVFHTVLPTPSLLFKNNVIDICSLVQSVIVMTNTSAKILINQYNIPEKNITVIPHGTHLVPSLSKTELKSKYELANKKVLATFGLLSSGKSIETTLVALPEIVKYHPDVLFLIIGKTHPTVASNEGECYRDLLQNIVDDLKLNNHVRFVNKFLSLPVLLEYLQLTDVYLFTSKDRHQAVSGTFSYAMSCGCPIVSTPIPHAKEFLKNELGIIIDFENPTKLSKAVNHLLGNKNLLNQISLNGIHRMAPTAWQNTAIAHAQLIKKVARIPFLLKYNLPAINFNHLKKLTTDFGIVQFAKINIPDIKTGYTIDDNARALVAVCALYDTNTNVINLNLIKTYLNFIDYCQQPDGSFLNYVNEQKLFTTQNDNENLQDSNGRAIWAVGYVLSMHKVLPSYLLLLAETIFYKAIPAALKMHSCRAMAFTIKGLYYASLHEQSIDNVKATEILADRLVQMYRHEANPEWQWYESYLTYGNSILPEAMLCAYITTGQNVYKLAAIGSFDFLLGKIFYNNSIKVITNKGWLHKGVFDKKVTKGGEQPIDVAYTILALEKFYLLTKNEGYKQKMKIAFSWFLGNNHLQQIIYNPCTGGCYDGLEDTYINLNQGAESTVSYLMARLTVGKYF